MNHYKILFFSFNHPYLFTGLQDIDNLRNYAYIWQNEPNITGGILLDTHRLSAAQKDAHVCEDA